jgi:hypothetical protein
VRALYYKSVLFLAGVFLPAIQAQYSWHTFYPMDRGQASSSPNNRAANPWATVNIINQASGLALADLGYAQGNGYSIGQWSYDGGSAEQWRVISLPNTNPQLYEIVNQASNLALVDAGYAQGNGYTIAQWSYDGGSDAQWQIIPVPNTNPQLYEIVNQASGLALVDAGYAQGNGYSIGQWSYDGGSDAQWGLQGYVPNIGSQLTLRAPSTPPNFPSTVAAWPGYYNSHQPQYYLNWWCQTQPVDAYIAGLSSQACLDINPYSELITEIPSLDGSGTVLWLGLWAGGNYGVYYDLSSNVCNDALNLASNPSNPGYQAAFDADVTAANIRPLLFGLPSQVNSPVSGPAACKVSFSSHTQFNHTTFVPSASATVDHIVTTLYDDFSNSAGHWIEAVNFYYSGVYTGNPSQLGRPTTCVGSLPSLPNGSAPSLPADNTGACAVFSEGYFMVDASSNVPNPSLWNGMVAWQAPTGDFTSSGWIFDHDWFLNGFGQDHTQHLWGSTVTLPSSQQFSFDSVTVSWGANGQLTLTLN